MIKGILIVSIVFIVSACTLRKTDQSKTKSLTKLCAPVTADTLWYQSDNAAPLFEGLDVIQFSITTNNDKAQRYFNQGLALSYGFNHAEAARSFYYATKLDPNCAMAYWAYAYVLGPNYNAGMESGNYLRAFNAIQMALDLSDACSTKEQALIHALSKRYVKEAILDRSSLDIAYSKAMKQVYLQYPDDANIGALYAESLMDLHPWDLWDKSGKAREWTPEILDVLDQTLKVDPKHIGAHHFYIHAVEASNHPENGLNSAKLLDEGLAPGSGHLVHMPSHIYIRTGDYAKGTVSNINAVKVDSTYITTCHAQGAYPLAYYPHNYHFMAATATLEGNQKWAIIGADKVSELVNVQLMKEPGWGTLQHYYSIPYYVYVKFGLWDKILAMENDDPTLKYPEAVRHYARGMSFLGIQKIDEAKKELQALERYASDESLKSITVWDINSVYTLIQIAKLVLKAEVLANEKMYAKSISLLKEAIVIEDALNYNEPPDWFFSVRHHLGAVQVEAQQYHEAVNTFEEDLERLPKNGWALHGLRRAYEGLNDKTKVEEMNTALETIWASASVELNGSRIK